MTRLGAPLRDARISYLLVGLVAALVYVNSLSNLFAYDDVHIVENNEALHELATIPDAMMEPYWPNDHGRGLGLWRPVTTGLFGLQWVAGGGSPVVFHAVNVVAHVASTLLVLALLVELMSLAAASVGALVFAVHPVHVEAVANIVGFAEIISTVALLAALLVHVRGGPSTGWGRALAIGALYLIGFGAKESGVTLPGLLLLVDAVRRPLGFAELPAYLRDRWRVYLVMLLVAVGLLVVRYGVLGSLASAFAPLGAELLEEIPRIWTLGQVWLHYVRLWVFPLDLSADYSPNVIRVATSWGLENTIGVVLALLVLCATLVAWRRPDMVRGRDTAKAAAFGVVWFLIAISPTSNTIFLSGVLLAERTFYLPSVGLAAATGWLVVRLARERPRVVPAILVLTVLGSSVRTWTRNETWYDSSRALTVLVRDYPQSGRSQWILGDQFLLAGRPSEAFQSYRAAISLLGASYSVLTEIAQRMIEYGYNDGAERLLPFAIEERPEFSSAYRLMSSSRAERGDAVGAEYWSREALAREAPGNDPARHHILAWALAAQGRMEEASEARARGDALGRAVFWQGYVYEAYAERARGDSATAVAKLDTAWAAVRTDLGRRALDSVIVSEFGLASRRDDVPAGTTTAPGG
jgi:tetratricopeptide (TPR) repeat protein